MPNLIPNTSSNRFVLLPLDQEVWINGARRQDAYCTEAVLSVGGQTGFASIWFPQAQYDSRLVDENSLVEVKIKNHGVIFRGFITARQSTITDRIIYTALDISEKFNDYYFNGEYNIKDEVTEQRKFAYTAKQVAYDAYAQYYAWHENYNPTDFLLTINLESFPDIIVEETNIQGQPLLKGLQTVLENIDFRYRIKCVHRDDASIITAYKLGAGYNKQICRGTNPSQPYDQQPNGLALVSDITKTVNAADSVSHIWAEGDNRLIETAIPLASGWCEVADDYIPPSIGTIKDYVTVTERQMVLNNWEKYTTEILDLKAADNTTYKYRNPNYRKKYERVGTHYAIPPCNDVYYYNDDPDNYPALFGESNKRVKIESDTLQVFPSGSTNTVSHFLVYTRPNASGYFIKQDGFAVKNHSEVVFNKPFVDTVSNIACKGTSGKYMADSWNAEEKSSQYEVGEGLDFYNYLNGQIMDAGVWLVLPEFMTTYKVFIFDQHWIKVAGDLRDVGLNNNRGTHWFLLKLNPFVRYSAAGVGMPNGVYMIDSEGSEELSNEYAGMNLVLSNSYDIGADGFLESPANIKVYRIAFNSGKYLYIDNPSKDLTGSASKFLIQDIRRETKRLFENIWLNTAYQSGQHLAYFSGDLSYLKNKRGIFKSNSEFQWKTQYNNFVLAQSTAMGEEDKFTVTLNTQKIDTIKQFDQLQAWAHNQIQGTTEYSVEYQIALCPIDFDLKLGDNIIDNRVDSTTSVTGLRYDLENQRLLVTATSWS